MDCTAILKAIENLALAKAISEGETLSPWLEAVRVLAIVLVVGVIAMVDLRLLGWAARGEDRRRNLIDVVGYRGDFWPLDRIHHLIPPQ